MHGKYMKISYWEGLILQLAFEGDLEKQEVKFKATSLVDHYCRWSAYIPTSVVSLGSLSPKLISPLSSYPSMSCPTPPQTPWNRQLCGLSRLSLVSLVVESPFKFIAGVWNQAFGLPIPMTSSLVCHPFT